MSILPPLEGGGWGEGSERPEPTGTRPSPNPLPQGEGEYAHLSRAVRRAMPPPMPPALLLQDIALTFGGTPLLSGVELSVSPGERVCLVGRNGSGKSTLLRIAAGLVEPDSGSRFVQPGATIRYLPQEPDFAGFATTLAYVEAGLGPRPTRPPPRALSAGAARPARRRRPRTPLRRRGPPRRAGARAGALARHPAAGRADQPSRPAHHRMAGANWPACARARPDQP